MNNGLLFLGGLLVVVLSALFAVPNLIDWNGYRGVFEEEASKVLGRDVRVGGAVNLKLLPAPYVSFEKVRIANVTGQTGEPFIRVESFKMWLSGPALLRGILEASEIELNKPVLTLAVDRAGGGNWTNLELKPGDMPFVPRDLTLRSVKLIDGTVSIFNASSERIAEIDSINGELSADGLKGPFRFKGSAAWSGTGHDVQFATETAAADGSFGLKVSARADKSPNTYLLSGRISNLSSKPVFKGDWSGTLAVPGSEELVAAGKGVAPLLDLKSGITIDVLGAKFDDFTLSLDNTAEPQTMTGSAVATWATPPRFDITLASKWLDIDWLAGAGQASASFAKLRQLALGLMQSVAGDSEASAKVNLDQVKIGGETAGGLSIDTHRKGNVTHIKTFEASLPGGSRLDLDGDLKDAGGQRSFSGNLFIGGSNLARLRAWAEKSGMPIDIKSEGAFSIAGKLDIDRSRFSLADASGDISGRSLAGDLSVTHRERGPERIELTLQAAALDTSEFFPKTVAALETEFRSALGLIASDDGKKSATELPGDMRLRVIAGRLTDGEENYRDVDVSFQVNGTQVRLPSAKLTTANGLTIGLEGSIKTGEASPTGTIAYDLVGATPDAMQDLVRKAGIQALVGDALFKGLKAGKIAGLIELGRRASASGDVTFDGVVNGSHLSGSGEFDGGLHDWRSKPSRVQVTLDSPSLPALLSALGRSGRTTEGDTGDAGETAQVSLLAAGTLANGAKTRVEVNGHGLAMTFAGDAKWPENSRIALNGAVELKAADYADALAVAGLSLPTAASGTEAHGTLDLSRDAAGLWTVGARGLTLGTSTIGGNVTVSTVADGSYRIAGKIGADRIPIPGLLSLVVDKSTSVVAAGDDAPDSPIALATRSIWPDGIFDFAALGGTEADVAVGFGSLDLSGNLATRDGEFKLALSPGRLAVSDLVAKAAGGEMSGSMSLVKSPSGVTLKTGLKLDQAKLSSLSPAAKGIASIQLDSEAQAQSPAGLVAVMSGSGRVTLKAGELPGPTTAALSGVVDSVLGGKLQNDPHAISAQLLAAIETSRLALGDRDLQFKIVDGTVKFDPVSLAAPTGTFEATAAADLSALKLSAVCQVAANVPPLPAPTIPLPGWQPPPPKGPLPPATVVYEGPLDNLASVKPGVVVADLQRELTVRQVERNVQQLELSRRVDQERVRLEKERRAAAIAAARAKKQSERLPPVIPESAGTANGAAQDASPPAASPPPAPTTPPSPPSAAMPDANSQPDTPQTSAQPGGDPSPEAKPAEGGNTVLTPKITIEPSPPTPGENTQGDASGSNATIDPETGLPIASQTEAAARPATARPVKRPTQRSSSDEVRKSLGGFP